MFSQTKNFKQYVSAGIKISEVKSKNKQMETIQNRILSLGLTPGAEERVTELAIQELDQLCSIEQVS
jgi:hypothetical protein